MSKTVQFTYRAMSEEDVPAVQNLIQALRWPHRLEDCHFVCGLGKGIVVEAEGHVVGVAMYWLYGGEYATLGMVMVDPSWQGHGFGRGLTERCMDALRSRVVVLNATPAGLPLYEKFGFKIFSGLQQFQGIVSRSSLSHKSAPPTAFSIQTIEGERVRAVQSSDHPRIAALLNQACGMDRTIMLAALLDVAHGILLERDGTATGFAMLRRFGHGYVIGPVVAGSFEDARSMIIHFVKSKKDEFVRVDLCVPAGEDSPLSSDLESCGLQLVDKVATMVRGEPPVADGHLRSFAITNQALG